MGGREGDREFLGWCIYDLDVKRHLSVWIQQICVLPPERKPDRYIDNARDSTRSETAPNEDPRIVTTLTIRG